MTGRRLALLVASCEFEDPDFRQLVAPAADIDNLARVLQDPTIGDFDEVIPLVNESSYQVRQSIEAFFTDRHSIDLVLLYFSGHGIKDDEGKLYLAMTDTKRKRLRSTGIAAAFITEAMNLCQSHQQVLLLDCCYSGAFARGLAAVKAAREINAGEHFREGRGRVVLTASDAMQYAFEQDTITGEGVRSVFTQTLITGLKTGEADWDQDGSVSLQDLYEYISDRVTVETAKQNPRKWEFDVEGKIVIAYAPRPAWRLDHSDITLLLEQIDWQRYRTGSYSGQDPLLQIRAKLPSMCKAGWASRSNAEELTLDDLGRLLEAINESIAQLDRYDYTPGLSSTDAAKFRQNGVAPLLQLAQKLQTRIFTATDC